MIFKRYSNPFLFLDNLIEIGKFSDGIDVIMEENLDEKCWELFLHSNTNKNFNDFKEEILQPNISMEKEMSKMEIEAAVIKSKQILDGFVPPER